MNIIKKILCSFILIFSFIIKIEPAKCESRFGIKLSPDLSINNVKPSDFSSSPSFGFECGFIYDFTFRENHNIGTGLLFFYQGVNIKHKEKDFSFGVDYLEIPIVLKLYTNEILIDTQLFLFTGFLMGLKLIETTPKALDEKESLFRRVKLDFSLGGGIEYEFAMNTNLFFELGYRFSTFNCIQSGKTNIALKSLMSHILSFSLGIRF